MTEPTTGAGEFWEPPLQARHSTALRSVACLAFRSGSQNEAPAHIKLDPTTNQY